MFDANKEIEKGNLDEANKILDDYFSFSAEKTVRPGRPLPRASSGQARPEPFSAADQNKKPKGLKPPLWLLR